MPCRHFLLIVFLLLSPVVSAQCPAQPQTAYERVFCEIQTKGGGGALPSYEDFRRNDPAVQALLLKRPAARLGIALPAPGSNHAPASRPDESPQKHVESEPARPVSPPVPDGLQGCALKREVIQCPGQRYQLAKNLPNRLLADGVLGEGNKLGLNRFTGDLDNESEVRAYLSEAYDHYIAKMLEIGLGGATTSFTRFYHSFRRHESQGIDFAERMESTYTYLKQDKRNLAVSARLSEALPESLKHCALSGSRVIVCDDVATNWVYVQGD